MAEGEGVHIDERGDDEDDDDDDECDEKKKKKRKHVIGVRRADGFVGPAGCVCKHERVKKKPFEAFAKDVRTGKQVHVGYYATEAEARAALLPKQAELDAAFEATDEAFQAGVAATEGLPTAPDDITDAIPGKPYRHQDPKNKFVPFAAVVRRSAGMQQGLEWKSACAHVDPETGETWTCGQRAEPAGDGTPARFCKRHGGGPRCKGATLFGTGVYHACEYNVGVQKGKTDKYDGMCVRCFCVTADPNDPRVINAKAYMHAREIEVRLELEDAFPDYDWLFDQGYGRKFAVGRAKRPDARTVKHRRILIVEVDELSHVSYDCGKERVREEIFLKAGGDRMRTVMLRFNPDQYTDVATGDRIRSCFHYNKASGTVTVNPREKKQWRVRIEALCERIRVFLDPTNPAYMDEVPDPPTGRAIYMEELFYDDISGVTDAYKAKIRECFKKGAVNKKKNKNNKNNKRKAAEVAGVAV